MKTVLVPNAPWPEIVPFVPAKRKKPIKRKSRKVADENFIQWLEKIDVRAKK